ncbi:MAG: methyltransferase domain-containing protein [Gammaproteobacteria bacterium]|nr:methyltransferase domain-containing protein [Gammaproteobacteria bacterium]
MSEDSKNDHYIGKVGMSNDARLKIMNDIYRPLSLDFYRSAGLREGMSVLEAGCATGYVSIDLAKIIGSSGSVTAIDISNEQLAVARENAKAVTIENIDFVQFNIHQIDKLEKEFDFVTGRFVFMHISNPKQALEALYSVLKPGGIIALEETMMSRCLGYPESEALNQTMTWIDNYAKNMGLDFDFGRKLYTMVRELPCINAKLTLCQPVIEESDDKQIFPMLISECKDKLVETGIASATEVNQIIAALEHYSQQPQTFFSGSLLHQVSAMKPKS